MWLSQQTMVPGIVGAEGGYLGLGEAQRLKDLHSLNIFYTPAEERFDRITRLAARVLHAPMAAISFISGESQWIKSSFGLAAGEISREVSLCGHAIEGHQALVVMDTAQDERFKANPLVAGRQCIRFYAGHPIHTGAGSAVGVLSVMDTLPGQPSYAGLETLRDLAVIVERELTHSSSTSFQDTLIKTLQPQERRSSLDELTHMWKRNVVMQLAHLECAAASNGSPLSLLLVDVDHLNVINENYGLQMGDVALYEVAAQLRQSLRDSDIIGRYGMGTFLVLLRAGIVDSKLVAERIRESVARHMIPGIDIQTTVSIGVASAKTQAPTPALLISAADKAMRLAKENGRDQIESVVL